MVFDHWLTPTAQLADYVLPADYFLERPALMNQDGAGGAMVQQQVLQPRGECRSLYALLKGLADRMGLQSYFPWPDDEALLDYRGFPRGETLERCGRRHVPGRRGAG